MAVFAIVMTACGDNVVLETDELGIGAKCSTETDCSPRLQAWTSSKGRGQFPVCLLEFEGGYCSASPCDRDADCPDGSACIRRDAHRFHCLRTCFDNADCNANREPENEAECSPNATPAPMGRKVCLPR